ASFTSTSGRSPRARSSPPGCTSALGCSCDGRTVTSEVAVRVRVRLFAIQREIAGAREVALNLSVGATIEDAWTALVGLHPRLAPGRPSVRFALNTEYADADAVLDDGDEAATLPPLGGGADAPAAAMRILEIRESPFDNGILGELGDRLATNEDGAIVGFIGRTR